MAACAADACKQTGAALNAFSGEVCRNRGRQIPDVGQQQVQHLFTHFEAVAAGSAR